MRSIWVTQKLRDITIEFGHWQVVKVVFMYYCEASVFSIRLLVQDPSFSLAIITPSFDACPTPSSDRDKVPLQKRAKTR